MPGRRRPAATPAHAATPLRPGRIGSGRESSRAVRRDPRHGRARRAPRGPRACAPGATSTPRTGRARRRDRRHGAQVHGRRRRAPVPRHLTAHSVGDAGQRGLSRHRPGDRPRSPAPGAGTVAAPDATPRPETPRLGTQRSSAGADQVRPGNAAWHARRDRCPRDALIHGPACPEHGTEAPACGTARRRTAGPAARSPGDTPGPRRGRQPAAMPRPARAAPGPPGARASATGPGTYGRTASIRSRIRRLTPSTGTRSWVIVSRSRIVTAPSSSESTSTVTHHGVPISSWRR